MKWLYFLSLDKNNKLKHEKLKIVQRYTTIDGNSNTSKGYLVLSKKNVFSYVPETVVDALYGRSKKQARKKYDKRMKRYMDGKRQ